MFGTISFSQRKEKIVSVFKKTVEDLDMLATDISNAMNANKEVIQRLEEENSQHGAEYEEVLNVRNNINKLLGA